MLKIQTEQGNFPVSSSNWRQLDSTEYVTMPAKQPSAHGNKFLSTSFNIPKNAYT